MSSIQNSLKALRFAIPYALAAIVSAGALCVSIQNLGLSFPTTINFNVLLPLKAGLIGVLAAALLSFWGFFWTEVTSESTTFSDLPAVVRIYRRSFGYFVPSLLLLFVSIGADFYLLLANSKSRESAIISFGTFGASLFMMAAFVVTFSIRTLTDMNDLYALGTKTPTTTAAAQVEAVKSATDGQRT